MMDHEVVNVSGVRRFSAYTGYGPKFEFQGAWNGSPVSQTILTMDATTRRHFTEDVVLRDIRKAYLCFQGCRRVSTGRWGCGAFRGTPPHKFAQQLVAATLAGCELDFSTFGTLDGCDEILEAAEAKRPNGANLLRATLLASTAALGGEDFVANFKALLDPATSTEKVDAPVDVAESVV
jgi:poly(ADP-ribose) glycohydrolase